MLVLTRKLKDQIRIGENITITILRVKGNVVRVGIDAPRSVPIMRGELADKEEMQQEEVRLDFESIECHELEEKLASCRSIAPLASRMRTPTNLIPLTAPSIFG